MQTNHAAPVSPSLQLWMYVPVKIPFHELTTARQHPWEYPASQPTHMYNNPSHRVALLTLDFALPARLLAHCASATAVLAVLSRGYSVLRATATFATGPITPTISPLGSFHLYHSSLGTFSPFFSPYALIRLSTSSAPAVPLRSGSLPLHGSSTLNRPRGIEPPVEPVTAKYSRAVPDVASRRGSRDEMIVVVAACASVKSFPKSNNVLLRRRRRRRQRTMGFILTRRKRGPKQHHWHHGRHRLASLSLATGRLDGRLASSQQLRRRGRLWRRRHAF